MSSPLSLAQFNVLYKEHPFQSIVFPLDLVSIAYRTYAIDITIIIIGVPLCHGRFVQYILHRH